MSSGLMNRVNVNLTDGKTKDYDKFVCYNLFVQQIDEENEEIHITKYVSTNLDLTQNKHANICVLKTCDAMLESLTQHMDTTSENEREEMLNYKISNLNDAKSIVLRGPETMSVVKMGICFGLTLLGDNVQVDIYPTENINTIGKMIYVSEIIIDNVNKSLEHLSKEEEEFEVKIIE